MQVGTLLLLLSFAGAAVLAQDIPTECPAVDPVDTTIHLQHEYNCDQFYKCYLGQKFLYDCARGTVFDPSLQVCVHPSETNCTLPGSNAESQYHENGCPRDPAVQLRFPNAEDCTQFFQCVRGQQVPLTCDNGQYFSNEQQICVDPSLSECNAGGDEDASTGDVTEEDSVEDIGNETAQESAEEEQSAEDGGDGTDGGAVVPPTECPAVDPLDTTVHIAHEYDCNKFYKCSNGVKYLYSCAPADPLLVFDPYKQVCVYPTEYNCGLPGSSGGSGEGNGNGEDGENATAEQSGEDIDNGEDGGNTTTEPSGEDNGNGEDGTTTTAEQSVEDGGDETDGGAVVPPSKCPAVDPLDTTVHIAHEYDCNKFYKCSNGVKYLYSCAPANPPLVFDPILQVCVWPEDYECTLQGAGGGSGNSGEDGGNTTTEPSGENNGNGEDGTTTTAEQSVEDGGDGTDGGAVVPPTKCPAVDPLDTTVHIAHEYDCNKFYKCSNGIKYLYSCAPANPPLVFDPILQVCVWPEDYECTLPGAGGGSGNSGEDGGNTTTEPNGEDNGNGEDGTTTTAEQSVEDGGDGTDGGAVVPPTKCPAVDPLDTTVHIAHEYDCNKFYKCSNGIKYLYSCAPANPPLVFDPILQVCVWPEDYECTLPGAGGGSGNSGEDGGNTTTEPSGEDNGNGEDGTTTTAEQSVEDGGDGTDGGAVVPPTKCPAVDPLDTTVHIAHEYDCNKFYKCSNGVKYLYSCAPANPPLVFDPILQVCVWPEDYECTLPGAGGGSGSSGEDGGNTTTEPSGENNGNGEDGTTTTAEQSVEDGGDGTDGGAVVPPTKCPAVDPLDTTVHIAHEYDCNKFYKCSNGIKYLYSCAPANPPLVFDPILQVCVWPEEYECTLPGAGGGSGNSGEDGGNTTTEPSGEDNGNGEDGTTTTAEQSVEDGGDGTDGGAVVPPTKCPAVDPLDTTVHIAHEYDCNKFYKCSNGVKYLYSCAPANPPLVFDPILQVCVWPEDYECTLPGAGGGSGNSGEDGGNTTTEPSGENNGNGEDGTTSTAEQSVEDGGDGTDGGAVVPPTKCPAVDPLDTTVHIAHEYDCNKFYKCSNGVKYLYSCAPANPPLVFDPILQVCVWPEDYECTLPGAGGGSGNSGEDGENTTTEPSGEDNGNGEDGTATTQSVEDGGDGTDGGAVVPPTKCPAVDPLDTTVHIAHEYDCNKFYKCSNGVKYLYSCAPANPPLVFDPILQVCVWPEDYECTLPGAGGGSGNSGEDGGNTTTEPSGENNGNGEDGTTTTAEQSVEDGGDGTDGGAVVPPTKCPAVDPLDTTVHIAHEYDCNKFYKCSNGVKYLYSCAPANPPLVFDPILQVCVWPEDYECTLPGAGGGSGNSGEDGGNTTTEPSGEDNGNGEDGTATTQSVEDGGDGTDGGAVVPPTKCPAVDPLNTTVHIAHEYDCNKFYKCSNGVKYLYSCAPANPPLVFDPILQVCVWPEDYECTLPGAGGGSGNSGEDGGNTTTEPSGENNGNGEDGTTTTAEQSVEGTDEGAVVPPTKCPAVDPLDTTVHIAHEYDCNKFYKCSHGVKYLYSCAPANPPLVFDPILQVCVWPEDFECTLPGAGVGSGNSGEDGGNTTTEPSGENNGNGEDGTTTTAEQSVEDGGDGTDGGAVVPPTKCPAVDPLDTTVHIAHEYDCNKFYKCSNGVKYLYSCAPANPPLVFDPILQVCVWPEDYECTLPGAGGGSGNSGEDGGNTTTEPSGENNGNGEDGTTTTAEQSVEDGGDGTDGGAVVPPTKCPAVDPLDTTVHIAHEYDCNKFYKCSNGVKYLYSCAPANPPLVFDPILQVCVWPEDYECTLPGAGGGSGNSGEDNGNGEDGTTTTTEGNGEDGGNATTEQSTEDGGENGSDNSNEGSGGGGSNGCTVEGELLLPHEYDCNKFYQCSNGAKYVFNCAPSDPALVFDPTLQQCVWPWEYECTLPGSPGGSGGSNEVDEPTTAEPSPDVDGGTSAESNEIGPDSGEIDPVDVPENSKCEVCDNNSNIWPHETDCDKFWSCQNGNAVLTICSLGLQFNTQTRTCDFACNVNCVKPGSLRAMARQNGLNIVIPWDKIGSKVLHKLEHDLHEVGVKYQ